MKTLICGGEHLTLKLVQKELESEGHEIRFEWKGDDMLGQLDIFVPDILITEVLLPHLNGFEFIHIARERYPNLLIIVISSLRSERLVELTYRLGADDYIFKPFNPDLLKDRIKRVMRGKENSFILKTSSYAPEI